MSKPKRHHYVPKSTIERFCDLNGRVWCFMKEKRSNGVFPISPNNLFLETHLYSEFDAHGIPDPAKEIELSKLDGEFCEVAVSIIDQVVKSEGFWISESEKRIVDKFFYLQWNRVPEVWVEFLEEENFQKLMDRTVEKLTMDAGNPSAEDLQHIERIRHDPGIKARTKHNARAIASAADGGDEVMEALHSKGLTVCIIRDSKKSFLIGSLPVIILGREEFYDNSNSTIELWMPISSRIAISPSGSKGTRSVISVTDHSWIRKLNMSTYLRSNMVAGRSSALVKSIVGL